MVPGSVSSEKLLHMQVLGLHLRPAESEYLGLGSEISILTDPPGDSHVCSNLQTTSVEKEVEHWAQMFWGRSFSMGKGGVREKYYPQQ